MCFLLPPKGFLFTGELRSLFREIQRRCPDKQRLVRGDRKMYTEFFRDNRVFLSLVLLMCSHFNSTWPRFLLLLLFLLFVFFVCCFYRNLQIACKYCKICKIPLETN